MSAAGKPSYDTPRSIGHELDFDLRGKPAPSWADLADLAAALYWERRPQASAAALRAYRRRKLRASTPVEVWLRRAGEVA